jgi:hypothetical protein
LSARAEVFVPCALAARLRAEPLAGTASVVRSWVLVEQPGSWGPDALTQSGLDRSVGRALAERSRRERVRVLLIRRPDWVRHPDRGGPSRSFLGHTGPSAGWLRAVDGPAEALLDLDWSALRSPQVPDVGTTVEGPLLLVCTHGRHDRCCADFGRPLVRALHGAGIDGVWESSHLGGDRFAANLVALPFGAYLGRLDPADGPEIVRGLVSGRLSLQHYRGRCCYPPDVQRAEVAARDAAGWTALEGPTLVEVARPSADRLEATWSFPDAANVRVSLRRSRAEPVPLTCHAGEPSSPWRYAVEAVDVTDAARGEAPLPGDGADSSPP